MKQIDFIIIGAQKGGSSFLHELLREHPEVEMPNQEIAYFQEPDYSKIININQKIENLFKTNKLKGIKRPNYLGNAESPILIEDYGEGDIKLLAVLRDPVDRFISAFFHAISNSWITPFFLNKKILKILSSDSTQPIVKNLKEYGYYAKYLNKYSKTISKNNLLLIDFNFLTNNTQEAFDIVCGFLNINNIVLNKDQVSKPINVGAKSNIELSRRYIISKISNDFDKKNQRFYIKTSKSYLNILTIKLLNKLFFNLIKILKPKNVIIKESIKNKIRMLYFDDQKNLKNFKIIK